MQLKKPKLWEKKIQISDYDKSFNLKTELMAKLKKNEVLQTLNYGKNQKDRYWQN